MINATISPTVVLARPYPGVELLPAVAGWQPVATGATVSRAHAASTGDMANAVTAMTAARRIHAAKQAKGNAPPREKAR